MAWREQGVLSPAAWIQHRNGVRHGDLPGLLERVAQWRSAHIHLVAGALLVRNPLRWAVFQTTYISDPNMMEDRELLVANYQVRHEVSMRPFIKRSNLAVATHFRSARTGDMPFCVGESLLLSAPMFSMVYAQEHFAMAVIKSTLQVIVQKEL